MEATQSVPILLDFMGSAKNKDRKITQIHWPCALKGFIDVLRILNCTRKPIHIKPLVGV